MRKLLPLLAAILSTTSLWSSEFEFQCDDFYYRILANDTTVLVAHPEDGSNLDYSNYTTITIPTSVIYNNKKYTVEGIDVGAFQNCSSLKSVSLPKDMKYISGYAFQDCSSLTSINIPAGVTNIEAGAFSGCTSLASITIPNGVTHISMAAFNNCSSLNSIAIPKTITNIEGGAFAYTGIYNNESNWVNGVLYIGDCLIEAKMHLSGEYTIKNNTRLIADDAFRGCEYLTTIFISSDVQNIGQFAFSGCSSIISIKVDCQNPIYDSRENCNAIIETATNTLVVGCQRTIIPNNISAIGDYAFSYQSSLYSIEIPTSITRIGEGAFLGTGLYHDESNWENDGLYINNCLLEVKKTEQKDFIIKDGTKLIADDIWRGEDMNSITIPESIMYIGKDVFSSYSIGCIYVKTKNPPILNGEAFNHFDGIVFVPCGTSESYNSSEWGKQVSSFAEECAGNNQITYTSSDNKIVTPYAADDFGANIISNVYENGIGIITFDNIITRIGDDAFFDCSTLTSITIPNSVTSIGNAAFRWCSSLTSIDIPNSVAYISHSAFERCSALYSITLPENLTYISTGVFMNCTSLNSIAIPDGVRKIHPSTFQGCSSLTSITLPNSLILIDADAFAGCLSLISIQIPQNVTYIGNNAFGECIFAKANFVNLSSLEEETDNYWGAKIVDQEINGLLIKKDTIVDCRLNVSSVIIPNGITRIHNNAFSSCSSLTSITIPEGVTSIGYYAFKDCINLININIPNSVTKIDYTSFDGSGIYKDESYWENDILYIDDCLIWCRANPKECIIKDSTRLIAEEAFIGKELLKSITLNENLRNIGRFAFYGCSIDSIIIPKSVTYIGDRALGSCLSLESIIVEEGNSVYDSRENCNAVIESTSNTLMLGCKTTHIPNDVAKIGDSAFRLCGTLTSITIPSSVMSIQNFAFNNCENLDTIVIAANTPPSLGKNIFGYSPISLCYIPCGTKAAYEASDWAQYVGEFVEECNKCGDRLYWQYDDTQLSITGQGNMHDYDLNPQPWQQYRNKMQTITLPEGMTSIGASAFADCKYVKSVTIPAMVEKIYDSAFEDCRMLTTLTFAEPSALTSIGNWAFYNNHELKSVVVPEGVTEIGYAAFYGCTYLDELTLPASMEYIADNSFALCAKLRRMNVSATIPPAVEARTFEDVDRTIPVVVPDASVNHYKAAPVWQEFNIIGKNNVSTSVGNVDTSTCGVEKLIRNGQLIIVRDGVEYNAMGQVL